MEMAQNITKLPSFFKVLAAKDFFTQLQIPQMFVKTFSQLFTSNQFLLYTHSPHRFWKVEVEDANERTYFRKGWEAFVEQNLLEFLDFIVFKYVGPSTFKVEMYGSCGCEKEVEHLVEAEKEEEEEEESLKTHKKDKRKRVREEDEEEEEDVNKRMKHHKGGPSKDKIPNEVIKKERRQVTYIDVDPPSENEYDDSKEHVKRSIALSQEEARRFKSNHPFFQVDLHPSYVNSFMYLPTKFYKTYLKGKVKEVELEVSGRVWSVGLISVNGNQNYAKFSRGWIAFFEENKLKEGDVCIFEMKKRSKFQVHIFRC